MDYGQELESEYAYLAQDGNCSYDKSQVKVYVKNFYNVLTQNIT